jgi:fatty acid-binding protein DegV
MIAETMAEMKGKDYFSLSQKEQLNYYQKALAYVDDLRMIKKENTISPSIEIEQAMQEGIQKTNKMIGLGLDPSKSKDYDKFLEMQSIQQKYGNMIDDNLLKQIMVDDNPQRKAEVLATIDEAMKMQEKGMSPQEIIDIIKNTTRTKQAKGGSAGLDYLMGL